MHTSSEAAHLPQCQLLLSHALVSSVLDDTDKLRKFGNAISISRSFVDDNSSLKWCTGADCSRAIKARAGVHGVECSCGARFCFQCSQDDHTPCNCADLKRWMVKCKDDSETFNWLVANTKACPKCGTSIEKNGGCNHSERPATHCPLVNGPTATPRLPHYVPRPHLPPGSCLYTISHFRICPHSNVQEWRVQVRVLLGVRRGLERSFWLFLCVQ